MTSGGQGRLPGMPLSAEDVWVCQIDDGVPVDQLADRRRRRRRPHAESPPSERHTDEVEVWLVLRACPVCRPHAYCRSHWPQTTAERERPGRSA